MDVLVRCIGADLFPPGSRSHAGPARSGSASAVRPAPAALACRVVVGGGVVQFEELRFVCQEAALELLRTRGRPLPPAVVLPGPERTQLLALPELPDDDESRHTVLAELAHDRVTADGVPCWGFVAEADVGGRDAVVVAYGARRHAPHITAAPFDDEGGLEAFVASEELDPTALPFLHPLQHAVDALPAAGDVFGDVDPKRGGGGLPLIE